MFSIRPTVLATAIALVTALPALSQQQAAPSPAALPGGASELTERHGDWSVTCGMLDGAKQCFLSQVLGDPQTGQRSLSIELQMVAAGRAEGMLMAPFGLQFSAGVELALDERALAGPVPFLTCIREGCLVEIAFEGEVLEALKAGTTLSVSARPMGAADALVLPISLNGFTAASRRVAELGL